MYKYLISKDGKPLHLVEASSPSVAIADAAKDTFTAQRVEGAVADALKATVPTRVIPKAATTTAEPAAGEQQQTGGDENLPPAGSTDGDGKPPADPPAGKGGNKDKGSE